MHACVLVLNTGANLIRLQVSETELEQIARMSTEALLEEGVVEGAGGDATRQLLGQYGPTPLRATPAATPARTAPTGDRIAQEAQNLARLQVRCWDRHSPVHSVMRRVIWLAAVQSHKVTVLLGGMGTAWSAAQPLCFLSGLPSLANTLVWCRKQGMPKFWLPSQRQQKNFLVTAAEFAWNHFHFITKVIAQLGFPAPVLHVACFPLLLQ